MSSAVVLHASAVLFCAQGVLLRGASGAGKSDLALRLIDVGGALIADDYVSLVLENGQLTAMPSATTRGLIEVRGIGLVKMPFCEKAIISTCVDLDPATPEERMPESQMTFLNEKGLEGIKLRHIRLNPFHASAVAKLRAFLQYSLYDGIADY